jgi:hypothetical protein
LAASDIVNAVRSLFRLGDVAYRRANSESIMNKFAAQSNFINYYQTDIKEYKLNGSYSVATGITFFDGVTNFFYNSEIVGIAFYNGRSGVSGTTEFDIKWKNQAGVTQGSIFSTTPKITSASSNETVAFRSLQTGNDHGSTTGVTLPVLSKTKFLEGESLFCQLNSSMVSAQNCGITIFYRPIN